MPLDWRLTSRCHFLYVCALVFLICDVRLVYGETVSTGWILLDIDLRSGNSEGFRNGLSIFWEQ